MVVNGGVVNYYGTVNISVVYYGGIYICNGRVVTKTAAFPAASIITKAPVPKTIVYAAIKAYVRTPITGMEYIITAFITPVTGRP
jgi:hypothetical protein